ncbi:hypothetical protein BW730_05520 [Tessaracoccus aquimaris]|uniref:HTH gntR-type domain-containing protein n=1 Tax=Tessaracoccus aquimaris TaxID=1332264 RepID=A0A1Q2CLQ9_9ACTN|nr:GntR family transcriptional regulator [Tessaracoccus aquimaris]AQP47058.1 hypothetical protein BW730_05520 [Tessaracoccus aquimaris]
MHQAYWEGVQTMTLPWEDQTGPLARRVAAATARAIVEEEVSPGTLLTEVELATRTGVSRTPAREAMVQLEGWGLVRLLPKKGAIVTAVGASERRDLLAVRLMFEKDALTGIDDGALVALTRTLDDVLQAQRTAISADDLLGFAAADYRFHAAVILAGSNAVVEQLLHSLAPRFARLIHQVCLHRPDLLPRLLSEHEALANLARSGDADGFARAVVAHVEATHFADAVAR